MSRRRPWLLLARSSPAWLFVALGLGVSTCGQPAPAQPTQSAQPQCRTPGPWTRVGVTRTTAGGHLSPLKIAADPTVIRDGDRYRMWFTNGDSLKRTGVAYAESRDGLVWDVWRAAAPDPVMDLVVASVPGDWDAPGVETPDVVRTPEGKYRMYYSGNRVPEGSTTYAIGMAESDDGIAWRRAAQPVLLPENDWEQPACSGGSCTQGGVLEPSVLYDPAQRIYRMWYVGLGTKRDSFLTYRIGLATSPDGVTWTRRPDPVFDLGHPGSWDEMWSSHVEVMADPRAGFHMFYFGSALKDYREGVEIQRGAIGHAYSADGVTWRRNPANPVLSPRAGQPDAWSVGGPTVLAEDGKLRMWYFGSLGSGLASSIIMAEAACGP